MPPDAHDVRTVRAALSGQPYAEVAYADFVPSETVVQQICAQLHAVFGLHFRPRALSYQQYVIAALRGEAVAWSLTTAVPG
ncbi:hypothetical protein [Streptomyces sp. NEAU-S7GS2]|uniref:hypothetical protein n=1 Tax=Streptomyces sp. NEAU-S7GS2 TaxID=2202000 RepID=UPI000D6FE6B0|nr:hypothetical protein [Streptomyces sp. NEAU-S7GS2]AWN30085.1 hypothetical protein DKG71_31495 [Streptomyces sp. NEAU-S7GS2]